MGGFSYRGKNIASFGEMYYIPDASERGEYALPYDVDEEEIKGRSGAYYYGSHVEPREFKLRCYYEGMSQRDLEDIMHWFDRRTKGQLIFDDRDYVYYNVIPNARITMEDYKVDGCGGILHKGVMIISLKSYEAFGHLLAEYLDVIGAVVGTSRVGFAVVGEAIIGPNNETIIYVSAKLPAITSINQGKFYIYNPGTEPTPLNITMMGIASDGLITNLTNGQKCAIKG